MRRSRVHQDNVNNILNLLIAYYNLIYDRVRIRVRARARVMFYVYMRLCYHLGLNAAVG